jgi:predicted metal-binding transcription factor (methanogenesis marker protein 9)
MVVLMKPIIFRKPKFMRSDLAMKTYMQVAESIARMVLIHESRMTMDETLEYYCKVGEMDDTGRDVLIVISNPKVFKF